MGTETGDAEIWVHPLELAARFRLDFKTPDYVEPVRGADVARSVEVRRELSTITYSHATFTSANTFSSRSTSQGCSSCSTSRRRDPSTLS